MAQLHLIIDEGDRDTLLWALDLATRNARWFQEAMHSTAHERELGALREASLTRLRSTAESATTGLDLPLKRDEAAHVNAPGLYPTPEEVQRYMEEIWNEAKFGPGSTSL